MLYYNFTYLTFQIVRLQPFAIVLLYYFRHYVLTVKCSILQVICLTHFSMHKAMTGTGKNLYNIWKTTKLMLIWLYIFVRLWWLSAFSIKLWRGADHHWLENMVWIRLVYRLCVWLHGFCKCVLPQSLWHPPLHRIHPWLLSPRRGPRSPPSQTRCLTAAPQTAASCWPTSLEKKESHWVINE